MGGSSSQGELSRFKVRLELEGLGSAEGELVRIFSPRTVEAILKALPLEGRVAIWKGAIYFPTPIAMGVEKPRQKLEAGVIAYWPRASAICIAYEGTEMHGPTSFVGRVTSNLDLFRQAPSGTRIRFLKA